MCTFYYSFLLNIYIVQFLLGWLFLGLWHKENGFSVSKTREAQPTFSTQHSEYQLNVMILLQFESQHLSTIFELVVDWQSVVYCMKPLYWCQVAWTVTILDMLTICTPRNMHNNNNTKVIALMSFLRWITLFDQLPYQWHHFNIFDWI